MEGSFDSVFAPPAGLEPATRGLTRLAISLIEDAIRFSHVNCRNKEKVELPPSRSPICNLTLVAFLQSLSRAMPRGLEGNQAERCHCIEHAVGHYSPAFPSLSMKLGFRT